MLIKKMLLAMVLVLTFGAGNVLAGGDAAKGAELAMNSGCADCHGDAGLGDEDFPKLAGMDEALHVKLLKGFKGDSESEMADFVADLSDQDIADLAAYYATLSGE
ncbi:MAG: c-type cytochrome [Xanthomonadales bacterium]|nr:c-type cytochrome [Xanthomonadales bacterium]